MGAVTLAMAGLNGAHPHQHDVNGIEWAPSPLTSVSAGTMSTSPDATGTAVGQLASDDPLAAEQRRLEAALAAATARVVAADALVAERDEQVRAGLRAELVAAQQTLAAMERRHDEVIARLRADTEAEVERILAAAPSRAAAERAESDGAETNDSGHE